MFTTEITFRIGLVALDSRTELFTLDSRSEEAKIDNGIPDVTAWRPTGLALGEPLVIARRTPLFRHLPISRRIHFLQPH
jgi:hypothetical protein